MTQLLDTLENLSVLRALDAAFGRMLARLDRVHGAEVGLCGALASLALAGGHGCLPLSAIPALLSMSKVPSSKVLPLLPKLPALRQALQQSPLVGSGAGNTPLVLDHGERLYLRRYWQYEVEVAQALRARVLGESHALPAPERLRAQLAQYFPSASSRGPNWQAVAALLGLRARLALIVGGPGTGKTSTVLWLLALLVQQAQEAGQPAPRIALAAPTGKAAARMSEAIRMGKARAPAGLEKLFAAIPEQAATLHRLLGYQPGQVSFRHDAQFPLACDVLILDEGSMVDLALFAKLLAALPAQARLIVLGDREQLASVEAGNLLGALSGGQTAAYSAAFAELVQQVIGYQLPVTRTPGRLCDFVVELKHSHRFEAGGAIAQLAQAVRSGDAFSTQTLLDASRSGSEIGYRDFSETALAELLRTSWLPRCAALARATDPEQALILAEQARILTAVREGPAGCVTINQMLTRWLLLLPEWSAWREQLWYPGRLVLITANDPRLGLYNGDVGVAMPDAKAELSVWFRSSDGTLRDFLPATLPAYETAHAMTVHKAQGSEFDEVLLVLPRQEQLASRELLYTGVSRARLRMLLMATRGAVRAAVLHGVQRYSGLAERFHMADLR